MLLIPREELLLAVVEGNVLFWGGVMVVAGLYHAVSEAISFTWKAHKDRRKERLLTRILEGKQ